VNWWSINKQGAKTKEMILSIASEWNKEHEEKLTDDKEVREMVEASFKLWQDNQDINYPRYIQFEDNVKLDKFFKKFFNEDDDVVEEHIIDDEVEEDNVVEEFLEYENDSHMAENFYGLDTNLPIEAEAEDVEMTDQNEVSDLNIERSDVYTSGEDQTHDDGYVNNSEDYFNDECKVPTYVLELISFDHNYAQITSIDTNSYLQKIKARELQKSSRIPNYICEECGTDSILKESFTNHMKNKHGVLVCSTCLRLFSNAGEFIQHQQNEHGHLTWRLITCDICGEELARFGKRGVPHMDKHMKIVCNIDNCNKVFANFNYLQNHKLKVHRGTQQISCYKISITCRVCKVRFDSVEERKEHEKIHLNKLCDTCQLYTNSSINDCIRHKKTCSPGQKLEMEKDFVEEMQKAFDYLKNQDLQSSAGSSKTKHTKALFIGSILYKTDVLGNVEFHDLDGYSLWREDLHAPMYGSYSYNSSKLSTNAERNHNIMRPHFFKVYMHDIFPIGSTVLIKFNSLLRLPEYSFQLFDLKLWKEFNASGTSMKRSKFPFKKNFELPQFMQKTPELYGNNVDRGHLTPYFMACSIEDQQYFQLQGNIFPQMAPMNRGKWKSLELSIPNKMEAYGARFAHITTGCIYARDGNSFIMENDIAKVESYFKVVFYADGHGKIINLNCFLVNQYPIPDDTVSEVTLYDIDSIKNNHLLFLNSHLLETIPDKVLDYHKVSMKQHKMSRLV